MSNFISNDKRQSYQSNFNCENDRAVLYGDLLQFMQQADREGQSFTFAFDSTPTLDTRDTGNTEDASSIFVKSYMAGATLRRLLSSKHGGETCSQCTQLLTTTKHLNEHSLIDTREYTPGTLIRPNTQFTNTFNNTTKTIHTLLTNNYQIRGIRALIKNYLTENMAYLGCANHDLRIQFIEMCINSVFHHWCTSINWILRGTNTRILRNSDPIQARAFKYYNKFKRGQ